MSARELITQLVLPYDALRTLYEGGSEVRLYENTLIGARQVGKRIDTLGIEDTVAAREGALLKGIDHRNIVPVDDVVVVAGFTPPLGAIEIIMPYYPRGSVCDALQRGERFSVGEACRVVQAALLGLAELHERHGVLHRDMKSPNVFLSDDLAHTKVGDLGIAISMDERGCADAYPHVQIFSPPETLTTKRVDRRSDIYGVGLLLVEALVGPFPYDEYTVTECENRLAAGRSAVRASDLTVAPHVPPHLRRIIAKSTNRDPERRYGSAHAMSAALASAHFVDWVVTVDHDDKKVWEGRSSVRRDRLYRVHAERRTRDAAWRLRGVQDKNREQRIVDDEIVPGLRDRQAVAFFDQVVAIATAR